MKKEKDYEHRTIIWLCMFFLFFGIYIGLQIENIILKEPDTLQIESEPLTEAEAWKLFDEFWVGFQKAVANDDTNKIKKIVRIWAMCMQCSYYSQIYDRT